MKKLFKTLALTLALVLPFAAMAQEETAKTTINVGGDADSPNIAWTVTAEEEGDGIFVVTFDGAIKEGYHGYAMMDFSAPIFGIVRCPILMYRYVFVRLQRDIRKAAIRSCPESRLSRGARGKLLR